MKVRWNKQAMNQLRQSARYIRSEFGTKTKEEFMKEVHRINCTLHTNPNMGKTESLLADCPNTYRSIVVNRLNKIIYRIDGDTVKVVAFWDTRREPQTQAEQVV